MSEFSAEAIKLLLNTGRSLNPPEKLSNGDIFLTTPPGHEIHRILREEPEFITQTISLSDDTSFETYVNNYQLDGRSVLFADDTNGVVTVILNYHAGREEEADKKDSIRNDTWLSGPDAVGPCSHVVKYGFRKSSAWTAWRGVDRRSLTQSELAEFLEEHIDDVVTPDAGTLMELVNSLQVTKIVDIRSKINLSNGNQQWNCSEEDSPKIGGVAITVPRKIIICVPVFEDDEPYTLEAFFRYRMTANGLSFELRFQDVADVFSAASRLKTGILSNAVSLNAIYGSVVGR